MSYIRNQMKGVGVKVTKLTENFKIENLLCLSLPFRAGVSHTFQGGKKVKSEKQNFKTPL